MHSKKDKRDIAVSEKQITGGRKYTNSLKNTNTLSIKNPLFKRNTQHEKLENPFLFLFCKKQFNNECISKHPTKTKISTLLCPNNELKDCVKPSRRAVPIDCQESKYEGIVPKTIHYLYIPCKKRSKHNLTNGPVLNRFSSEPLNYQSKYILLEKPCLLGEQLSEKDNKISEVKMKEKTDETVLDFNEMPEHHLKPSYKHINTYFKENKEKEIKSSNQYSSSKNVLKHTFSNLSSHLKRSGRIEENHCRLKVNQKEDELFSGIPQKQPVIYNQSNKSIYCSKNLLNTAINTSENKLGETHKHHRAIKDDHFEIILYRKHDATVCGVNPHYKHSIHQYRKIKDESLKDNLSRVNRKVTYSKCKQSPLTYKFSNAGLKLRQTKKNSEKHVFKIKPLVANIFFNSSGMSLNKEKEKKITHCLKNKHVIQTIQDINFSITEDEFNSLTPKEREYSEHTLNTIPISSSYELKLNQIHTSTSSEFKSNEVHTPSYFKTKPKQVHTFTSHELKSSEVYTLIYPKLKSNKAQTFNSTEPKSNEIHRLTLLKLKPNKAQTSISTQLKLNQMCATTSLEINPNKAQTYNAAEFNSNNVHTLAHLKQEPIQNNNNLSLDPKSNQVNIPTFIEYIKGHEACSNNVKQYNISHQKYIVYKHSNKMYPFENVNMDYFVKKFLKQYLPKVMNHVSKKMLNEKTMKAFVLLKNSDLKKTICVPILYQGNGKGQFECHGFHSELVDALNNDQSNISLTHTMYKKLSFPKNKQKDNGSSIISCNNINNSAKGKKELPCIAEIEENDIQPLRNCVALDEILRKQDKAPILRHNILYEIRKDLNCIDAREILKNPDTIIYTSKRENTYGQNFIECSDMKIKSKLQKQKCIFNELCYLNDTYINLVCQEHIGVKDLNDLVNSMSIPSQNDKLVENKLSKFIELSTRDVTDNEFSTNDKLMCHIGLKNILLDSSNKPKTFHNIATKNLGLKSRSNSKDNSSKLKRKCKKSSLYKFNSLLSKIDEESPISCETKMECKEKEFVQNVNKFKIEPIFSPEDKYESCNASEKEKETKHLHLKKESVAKFYTKRPSSLLQSSWIEKNCLLAKTFSLNNVSFKEKSNNVSFADDPSSQHALNNKHTSNIHIKNETGKSLEESICNKGRGFPIKHCASINKLCVQSSFECNSKSNSNYSLKAFSPEPINNLLIPEERWVNLNLDSLDKHNLSIQEPSLIELNQDESIYNNISQPVRKELNIKTSGGEQNKCVNELKTNSSKTPTSQVKQAMKIKKLTNNDKLNNKKEITKSEKQTMVGLTTPCIKKINGKIFSTVSNTKHKKHLRHSKCTTINSSNNRENSCNKGTERKYVKTSGQNKLLTEAYDWTPFKDDMGKCHTLTKKQNTKIETNNSKNNTQSNIKKYNSEFMKNYQRKSKSSNHKLTKTFSNPPKDCQEIIQLKTSLTEQETENKEINNIILKQDSLAKKHSEESKIVGSVKGFAAKCNARTTFKCVNSAKRNVKENAKTKTQSLKETHFETEEKNKTLHTIPMRNETQNTLDTDIIVELLQQLKSKIELKNYKNKCARENNCTGKNKNKANNTTCENTEKILNISFGPNTFKEYLTNRDIVESLQDCKKSVNMDPLENIHSNSQAPDETNGVLNTFSRRNFSKLENCKDISTNSCAVAIYKNNKEFVKNFNDSQEWLKNDFNLNIFEENKQNCRPSIEKCFSSFNENFIMNELASERLSSISNEVKISVNNNLTISYSVSTIANPNIEIKAMDIFTAKQFRLSSQTNCQIISNTFVKAIISVERDTITPLNKNVFSKWAQHEISYANLSDFKESSLTSDIDENNLKQLVETNKKDLLYLECIPRENVKLKVDKQSGIGNFCNEVKSIFCRDEMYLVEELKNQLMREQNIETNRDIESNENKLSKNTKFIQNRSKFEINGNKCAISSRNLCVKKNVLKINNLKSGEETLISSKQHKVYLTEDKNVFASTDNSSKGFLNQDVLNGSIETRSLPTKHLFMISSWGTFQNTKLYKVLKDKENKLKNIGCFNSKVDFTLTNKGKKDDKTRNEVQNNLKTTCSEQLIQQEKKIVNEVSDDIWVCKQTSQQTEMNFIEEVTTSEEKNPVLKLNEKNNKSINYLFENNCASYNKWQLERCLNSFLFNQPHTNGSELIPFIETQSSEKLHHSMKKHNGTSDFSRLGSPQLSVNSIYTAQVNLSYVFHNFNKTIRLAAQDQIICTHSQDVNRIKNTKLSNLNVSFMSLNESKSPYIQCRSTEDGFTKYNDGKELQLNNIGRGVKHMVLYNRETTEKTLDKYSQNFRHKTTNNKECTNKSIKSLTETCLFYASEGMDDRRKSILKRNYIIHSNGAMFGSSLEININLDQNLMSQESETRSNAHCVVDKKLSQIKIYKKTDASTFLKIPGIGLNKINKKAKINNSTQTEGVLKLCDIFVKTYTKSEKNINVLKKANIQKEINKEKIKNKESILINTHQEISSTILQQPHKYFCKYIQTNNNNHPQILKDGLYHNGRETLISSSLITIFPYPTTKYSVLYRNTNKYKYSVNKYTQPVNSKLKKSRKNLDYKKKYKIKINKLKLDRKQKDSSKESLFNTLKIGTSSCGLSNKGLGLKQSLTETSISKYMTTNISNHNMLNNKLLPIKHSYKKKIQNNISKLKSIRVSQNICKYAGKFVKKMVNFLKTTKHNIKHKYYTKLNNRTDNTKSANTSKQIIEGQRIRLTPYQKHLLKETVQSSKNIKNKGRQNDRMSLKSNNPKLPFVNDNLEGNDLINIERDQKCLKSIRLTYQKASLNSKNIIEESNEGIIHEKTSIFVKKVSSNSGTYKPNYCIGSPSDSLMFLNQNESLHGFFINKEKYSIQQDYDDHQIKLRGKDTRIAFMQLSDNNYVKDFKEKDPSVSTAPESSNITMNAHKVHSFSNVSKVSCGYSLSNITTFSKVKLPTITRNVSFLNVYKCLKNTNIFKITDDLLEGSKKERKSENSKNIRFLFKLSTSILQNMRNNVNNKRDNVDTGKPSECDSFGESEAKCYGARITSNRCCNFSSYSNICPFKDCSQTSLNRINNTNKKLIHLSDDQRLLLLSGSIVKNNKHDKDQIRVAECSTNNEELKYDNNLKNQDKCKINKTSSPDNQGEIKLEALRFGLPRQFSSKIESDFCTRTTDFGMYIERNTSNILLNKLSSKQKNISSIKCLLNKTQWPQDLPIVNRSKLYFESKKTTLKSQSLVELVREKPAKSMDNLKNSKSYIYKIDTIFGKASQYRVEECLSNSKLYMTIIQSDSASFNKTRYGMSQNSISNKITDKLCFYTESTTDKLENGVSNNVTINSNCVLHEGHKYSLTKMSSSPPRLSEYMLSNLNFKNKNVSEQNNLGSHTQHLLQSVEHNLQNNNNFFVEDTNRDIHINLINDLSIRTEEIHSKPKIDFNMSARENMARESLLFQERKIQTIISTVKENELTFGTSAVVLQHVGNSQESKQINSTTINNKSSQDSKLAFKVSPNSFDEKTHLFVLGKEMGRRRFVDSKTTLDRGFQINFNDYTSFKHQIPSRTITVGEENGWLTATMNFPKQNFKIRAPTNMIFTAKFSQQAGELTPLELVFAPILSTSKRNSSNPSTIYKMSSSTTIESENPQTTYLNLPSSFENNSYSEKHPTRERIKKDQIIATLVTDLLDSRSLKRDNINVKVQAVVSNNYYECHLTKSPRKNEQPRKEPGGIKIVNQISTLKCQIKNKAKEGLSIDSSSQLGVSSVLEQSVPGKQIAPYSIVMGSKIGRGPEHNQITSILQRHSTNNVVVKREGSLLKQDGSIELMKDIAESNVKCTTPQTIVPYIGTTTRLESSFSTGTKLSGEDTNKDQPFQETGQKGIGISKTSPTKISVNIVVRKIASETNDRSNLPTRSTNDKGTSDSIMKSNCSGNSNRRISRNPINSLSQWCFINGEWVHGYIRQQSKTVVKDS